MKYCEQKKNNMQGNRKSNTLRTIVKRRRRNRWNKKGTVAVFLTMILAAVFGLTAVFFEGACSAAARSISEGLLESAGRSALSEYHKALQNRYGIFARESEPEDLKSDIQYYIEASLTDEPAHSGQTALAEQTADPAENRKKQQVFKPVSLSLLDLNADGAEYSLLIPEVLEKQILDFMKYKALSAGIDLHQREAALTGGITELINAGRNTEKQKREAKEAEQKQAELDRKARQEREENGESGEDPEEARRKRKTKQLKNMVTNLKKRNEYTEATSEAGERVLRSEQEKQWLPSKLTGVSGFPDIGKFLAKKDANGNEDENGNGAAHTGGILTGVRNSIYLDEYILLQFKCHTSGTGFPEAETFFENEVEYILCGHDSDQANLRQIKTYLFTIRTALNLAHVYSDEGKRNATLEAAAAIAPGPGAPAVQFLIATLWAGLESEEDLRALLAGERVPLIKSADDWKTDLFSAGKAVSKTESEAAQGSGQTYEDYLRFLLFMQNRECRLMRALDLIQLNIRLESDRSFLAERYCAGFTCIAEFGRRTGMRAPFSFAGGYQVEKIHLY